MELNAKIPAGPISDKWNNHRFEMKLVNPANRRKYQVIVVGSGLAGGAAAATWASWLQRQVLLLPGQRAPGPQHRRPGRHQRRQELPERRRQRLPAVLRHGEGGRLPVPRGQRLSAGRAQPEHHRPVRGPGGALRPGVRRAPGQPVLRRRAGGAHLLRSRPDRGSSSCSAATRRWSDRSPRGPSDLLPPRDAGPHRGGRPRARDRGPGHGHAGTSTCTWPTWWSWPRAATATSTTCPPTRRGATSRPSGGPTSAAPAWPTPASRRSTRPASRPAATISPSSRS
jgi:hypothetical protein